MSMDSNPSATLKSAIKHTSDPHRSHPRMEDSDER
jgi:hypothetical protein